MKRIMLERRTDLAAEIPLETPYCLFVDPSSCCNFQCRFCMNSRMRGKTVMKWDVYTKIVDDLKAFPSPLKTLRLYGLGEPLLNPRFVDMVRYAAASPHVLNIDTTTNASELRGDAVCALAASGIDRVNISVNAMSTDKYRAFTKNGNVTFEGIVANVKALFGTGRTTVFVKADGDYLSPDEQKSFRETFEPISDGCAIEHTMSCWRGFEVPDANKSVGIYGRPLQNVAVCPYIFYGMFVHADGVASACFLDWNRKLVVGDTRRESIKSIWDKKAFWELRVLMLRKRRSAHPACRDCQQLVAGMPVDLDGHANEILERCTHAMSDL